MTRFIILLILLAPLQLYATPQLALKLPKNVVSQGDIIRAKFSVDSESYQKIASLKLAGLTLGNTIHIVSFGVPVKLSDQSGLTIESSLIFLRVPESRLITAEVNGVAFIVDTNQAEVIPTEAPEEFIFTDFTLPEKSRWILYSAVMLFLLLALAYPGWKFFKVRQTKKLKQIKQRELKDELLNCRKYEDVVEIWKKKHRYLLVFPQLKDSFTKLEITLFKYQFKPQQTESEKIEVMNSYRTFKSEVEGGVNGI